MKTQEQKRILTYSQCFMQQKRQKLSVSPKDISQKVSGCKPILPLFKVTRQPKTRIRNECKTALTCNEKSSLQPDGNCQENERQASVTAEKVPLQAGLQSEKMHAASEADQMGKASESEDSWDEPPEMLQCVEREREKDACLQENKKLTKARSRKERFFPSK